MKKIYLLLILMLGLSLCSCGQETPAKNEKEKNVKIQQNETKKMIAEDFLDFTFGEVKDKFGNQYSIPDEGYDGSSIVSFENIPFAFAFPYSETGEISEDTKVGGVYIGEGGFVTDKIKVGMTFQEIESIYGSPIEVGEDSDNMYDYFCAIELGDKIAIFSAESKDGKTYTAMLKYIN